MPSIDKERFFGELTHRSGSFHVQSTRAHLAKATVPIDTIKLG
jgi:hypothetical protein